MRAFCALLLLWSGAASAQTALFFEDHGCTIGPDSQNAAAEVGIDEFDIDLLLLNARNAGQLQEVGAYAVLGPELCTIRIPELNPTVSLEHPELLAQIVRYDETPGCFFGEVASALETAGVSFPDYVTLVAAGFLSGDLRFYGTSPLQTPVAIQLMQGSCGDVPARAEMETAAGVLTDDVFDRYIRATAEGTACDDGRGGHALELLADIQMAAGIDETQVNAWMFFELDMMAWAAGWRTGMTWERRGTLRPPLCDHYE